MPRVSHLSRTVASFAYFAMITSAHRAGAAAFNCNGNVTSVERMICVDPVLSSLDDQVANSYKMAMQNYPQPDRVQRSQRQWLAIRNRCRDVACISAAYNKRNAEIERLRRPWIPGCTGGVSVCLGEYW